jgi:hypothetical protein
MIFEGDQNTDICLDCIIKLDEINKEEWFYDCKETSMEFKCLV